MEDLKQKLQELFESSDWPVEDRNWLLDYLEKNDTSALQQIMQQQFTENIKSGEKLQGDPAKQLLERIREKIKLIAKPAKVVRINNWKRIAAAAVIILLGTSAFSLFFNKKQKEIAKTDQLNPYKDDVAPGGNKAVLQLADGSTIILDRAANGTLTQQGNTKILKQDGQLAYNLLNDPSTSLRTNEVLYNTITTPRGGQYQLILSDGSKVWLNAASSLRFPATFIGNERKVELTGEAYFEVAKNAAQPFRVELNNGMKVEALGTHFNVMGYDDEDMVKTTLVEGKVKISQGTNIIMLSPNQQAKLTKADNAFLADKNADVNKAIAWKNGLFDFDDDNITDIMRQLSRWYDVDIYYSEPVTEQHYTGSIRREVNISQVLHMLELAGGVEFTITGKKIVVKTK